MSDKKDERCIRGSVAGDAFSIELDLLYVSRILVVYGNKQQSRRKRGGRTNRDDCLLKKNLLLFSSAVNKIDFTSLRTLRLCG